MNNPEIFAAEDIEKNKTVSAFAYFIFFLPLIVCPDSAFGRYHANQGLVLLIISVLSSIVLGFIPIIGWIISSLIGLAVFAGAIYGLINTLNGQAVDLPIIGQVKLIK